MHRNTQAGEFSPETLRAYAVNLAEGLHSGRLHLIADSHPRLTSIDE